MEWFSSKSNINERSIFSSLTELFTGETLSEERKLRLQLSKQLLIQRLQKALRTIVMHVAQLTNTHTELKPLHNNSTGVQELLTLVEACFAHGLKPQAVIANDYPIDYWDFICTLRASSDAIANATLDMIATTTQVRSTYGRCRAWLRKLINQKALEYNVRTLTSDPNVTKLWYHENALMAEVESASLFTSMMAALNGIGFELLVDDPALENIVPSTTVTVVTNSGVKEANTAYRTSGVKDGVHRYENDRGLEIFRSEVASGNDQNTLVKRWFIGDPNRRVAVFYANVPSNQPPYEGWVVHPSGGTAPTPKVVTFQIPSIAVLKQEQKPATTNDDTIGGGSGKSSGETSGETKGERSGGDGGSAGRGDGAIHAPDAMQQQQQEQVTVDVPVKQEVVQIDTVVPTDSRLLTPGIQNIENKNILATPETTASPLFLRTKCNGNWNGRRNNGDEQRITHQPTTSMGQY